MPWWAPARNGDCDPPRLAICGCGEAAGEVKPWGAKAAGSNRGMVMVRLGSATEEGPWLAGRPGFPFRQEEENQQEEPRGAMKWPLL